MPNPTTFPRRVRVRSAGAVHDLTLVPERLRRPPRPTDPDGVILVLGSDGTQVGHLSGFGVTSDVAGPWIVRLVDPATGERRFPARGKVVHALLRALRIVAAAGRRRGRA